jgi:hypothetical protein
MKFWHNITIHKDSQGLATAFQADFGVELLFAESANPAHL